MPTTFLRFSHLKARGIINNWPMLRQRIEHELFPPGRYIGVNTRVWTEDEIETHLAAQKLAADGASAAEIMAATSIAESALAQAYVALAADHRRKREAAQKRARRRRTSNEETHAA